MDWDAALRWLERADWLAIATVALALATSFLAAVTWRGVRENKHLIEAAKRQSDLLWENAMPYLIPENVDGVPVVEINMSGRLRVTYAAGTIPARAVTAWVGHGGEVRVASQDLMTRGDSPKLKLVQSRAGSEPPKDWNEWLRRQQEGVSYRIVMRWSGPGDHVTERAWWLSFGVWTEVPANLRG